VTIFTIGHSVRPFDEFLRLLTAHGVKQLADVRTVPRSRRHPQFTRDALERSLPGSGVAYRHLPGLGGLRKPRRDSHNTGWRVEGFRGYADYMETPAFEQALGDLVVWAGHSPTVVMCAESLWWKCHRQLIADALTARGVEMRHISSERSAPVHSLTAFARLIGERVTYPGLLEVGRK
jgi:uncharacterized protein (DUF488 family)